MCVKLKRNFLLIVVSQATPMLNNNSELIEKAVPGPVRVNDNILLIQTS